jgi:2-oxoadipate dioxygenase/decarboxylase-like protein
MPKTLQLQLTRLLDSVVDPATLERSLKVLHLPRVLAGSEEGVASRSLIALALNVALFGDLLERVPTGCAYVNDCLAQGREVVFDHGALRTVALAGMGSLPAGEAAITRVLLPLGYRMNDVYPLDRLGMTGRAYTHIDHPEVLPQFFVSELHPERFSPAFIEAVRRVTVSSVDPLTEEDLQTLQVLQKQEWLNTVSASELIGSLLGCFGRQHSNPSWADYQILLAESAEMAWISTEGNAFNHATDRVASIDALVDEQRKTGRALKPTIESSKSGRVRQTAFRADMVMREFLRDDGSVMQHQVPGSFYEFIQRDFVSDPATGSRRLDLAFDSSNAQGIFKMTSAAGAV